MLREERDIKLQTVANEIGMSHATLSKIENGKHLAVKHTTLMDIARYYGKPLEFLLKSMRLKIELFTVRTKVSCREQNKVEIILMKNISS